MSCICCGEDGEERASFYSLRRRAGQTNTFRSNVHLFRLLIQEYVAPIISHVHQLQWRRLGIEDPEPWDLMYPAEFGVPVLSRQAFPLEKTFIDASRYVCEAQVPAFEKMLDQGTLSTGVLSNTNDDSESSFFANYSSGTRWLRAHDPEKNESYLLMEGIPQEIAANLFFYETGFLQSVAAFERRVCAPECNSSLSSKIAGHSLSFLSQRTWGNFTDR